MGYPHRMNSANPAPDNPGTGPSIRNTPESMSQADRANGEGSETDGATDEDSDDPADTGVQDGD